MTNLAKGNLCKRTVDVFETPNPEPCAIRDHCATIRIGQRRLWHNNPYTSIAIPEKSGWNKKVDRTMRLDHRVALVTGGGSGIGAAICRLFAAEGATVIVADIVADRALEVANAITASQGNAIAVTIDVADETSVTVGIASAVSRTGPVDILVNNAAVSIGNDILTIEPDVWDRNLSIVLRGPYLCSRAVLPSMIERRSGGIINISSVNGMTGLGEEPYSAAKAGLLNLTQNMAIKYGQFGIRCNAISPATIRTPIWNDRLAEAPDAFEILRAWYPLRRVGEAEDVAKAALFLASDESSFVTGINLPVDGGLTAGSYGMMQSLQGE